MVTERSNKVEVFIFDKHAIPDVSRKTGISVEELSRRFNEAKEKGILCVFEAELPNPNWKEVLDARIDRRERRDASGQNGPH